MFSQKKITGSFQMTARFSASAKTPWLTVPSPKKVMRNPVGAVHLRGERGADRDRDARADDGVLTQQADATGR